MKFSITSKVLTLLGNTFIGTPASLRMPDDFYSEKGDRYVPSSQAMLDPKVQRERIATDAFRRMLALRVGILASLAVASLSGVTYLLIGFVK